MKKILQIFLIAALSLSFVGKSYGQEADTREDSPPSKNTEVEKPADKIKIKEDTKTLEEDKGQAGTVPLNEEVKSQEDANNPEGENKNSPSQKDTPKQDRDIKPVSDSSKKDKVDYEKVEKAVDDLVEKLDKNSSLSKALEEVKVTIKANNDKASPATDQVNKQAEKVIKDYSKKIQQAKSPSQKRELEKEATKKIKSISIIVNEEANKKKASEDEPKKRLTKEVKVDYDDDLGKIYALAPAEDEESDYLSYLKKPVVIIVVILIVSLLITIGIVIRRKDKNEIDSY